MNLLFLLTLTFLIIILTFLLINLNNPMHAVINLICIFLVTAVLLFSLGIEFLGFLLILVYASGVSILFLFSIFIFNIKIQKTSFFKSKLNLFVTTFLSINFYFILLNELQKFPNMQFFSDSKEFTDYIFFNKTIENFYSFVNLSQLLYIEYFVHLLLIGFLLFIVLIGILMLILPFNKKLKKNQFLFKQLSKQSINSFNKISNK